MVARECAAAPASPPNEWAAARALIEVPVSVRLDLCCPRAPLRTRKVWLLMQIGVYTFVENTPDPATGRLLDPAQRLRDLMEEVALADQVGLDVFGIGEHHRPDFLASAPPIMLAAAAEHTKAIRLSTAVTVLSSDDPVRVYEQFATLDLLSGGRAEIMAGRGSFIESFPLFGYDLNDYDELFAEKLELLVAVRDHERGPWQGAHRAPSRNQAAY